MASDWRFSEKCPCGAEFQAEAEGAHPSVVGLVRMRHLSWTTEHTGHTNPTHEAGINRMMQLITPEIMRRIDMAIDQAIQGLLEKSLVKPVTWTAPSTGTVPTTLVNTSGGATVGSHTHTITTSMGDMVIVDDLPDPTPHGKITGVLSERRRIKGRKVTEVSTTPPIPTDG